MSRTLRILCLGFALAGISFGWLAYSRSQLSFNDEGRDFDVDSGTVYKDDAVVVYGAAAVASLVISGATLALSRPR